MTVLPTLVANNPVESSSSSSPWEALTGAQPCTGGECHVTAIICAGSVHNRQAGFMNRHSVRCLALVVLAAVMLALPALAQRGG